MPMIIKICGLRRVEDAEMINKFNEIKYAGFVFAKSKRQITAERACEIKKHLRPDIKTVGVFADQSVKEVIDICRRTDIDICQLHSDEDDEFCSAVKIPVWKAIRVKDENSIKEAEGYKNIQGFLLDAYSSKERGGTGKIFNWECAKDFSKRYFTILAGGINSGNIKRAYEAVKPDVIDLSSAVETEGYKDITKIKELIDTIRKD